MPGATFRRKDKDGNWVGEAVTLDSNVMADLGVLLFIPQIGAMGIFGFKLRLQPAIEQGTTSNVLIKEINGVWYTFKSSLQQVMEAINCLWGAFAFKDPKSRVVWGPDVPGC